MPRPPKWRHVESMPEYNYFKPAGVPIKELEEIILNIEELEAIRLKDGEGYEQETCAERMKVSRPTFQRILSSARKKVTEALIKGKAIKIEGGKFKLPMRYFKCINCENSWEIPFGTGQRGIDLFCPRCESKSVCRHRHKEDEGE